MSNHVQKLSNRILAMILTVVMIVGMIPMSVFAVSPSTVETTLGTSPVYMGEEVEFTVSTKANDDLNTPVFGYFDFNGGDWSAIEYLKYKESKDDNWYDLPQGAPFGPPETGFPMMDATSTFLVKFKEAGTYSFSVFMKTADENKTELCALTEQITVLRRPCQITTTLTDPATKLVVDTPTEFTVRTTPNDYEGEMVFGKFSFSNWDAVDSLQYWGTTEDQWLDLPKDTLFGPAATGFPLMDTESKFRVTFNTAGEYTFTLAMVKAELEKPAEEKTVLSEISAKITVTETIPPVVDTISGNPANWAQSATVTGTVSDQGGSGVQKVVYSKDSTYAETHIAATLSEGAFSFVVSENATYYVWAIDGNSNISEAKSIVIDKIDTTLPELNVQANPDSWTNGVVKVEVSASDASGVTVKYNTTDSFDDATELPLVDGKAEIPVSGEYNGTYYVWAVDTAGNKVAKNVAVKIDTTEPTVIITTVPSNVWTNGDVTIEGTVEDSNSAIGANSGIDKVVFGTDADFDKAPGEAPLSEGKYSFTVTENGTYNIWSVDKAGNYSKIATITIANIDKVAPSVDAVKVEVNDDNQYWWNMDLTVSGSVSDVGGSGVAKVVYSNTNEYKNNLSEAKLGSNGTYSFDIPLMDYDGEYYVWAIDGAGNVTGEAKSTKVHMDATKPVVQNTTANPNKWTNDDVKVTVSVWDNRGVAMVAYNTTNSYTTVNKATKNADGTFSFTVSNDQEYNGKYYVWAIDEAGNVSNLSDKCEVEVLIDTTAPTVDSITADPNVATNKNVTISGKVSDTTSSTSNSDIAKVVYSTNSTFGTGLKEVMPDSQGNYSFVVENNVEFNGKYYVWAIDNAGNHTTVPAEVNVHIDITPATATVSVSKGAWHDFFNAITFGLYYKENFTVTIDANDGDSGVQSVEYCISSAKMELDALKQVSEWENYTSPFEISGEQNLIVYVRVIDKAGTPEYFNSDGIILDKTPTNISLIPSAPVVDNGINGIYGFYNDDVTVDIKVNDAEHYSGIKSIEYWVTKDGVETARKTLYSFGYDGNYDATKNWEITGSDIEAENKTYKGIPTHDMLKKAWSGSIVVPADKNNSCNVVVTVKVTDNAGHTTTEEVKLDIDNKAATAPVVKVEYADEGNKYNDMYFDGNRTATITITERSHHFVEPTVYINENVPTGATNYIHITAVDANGNKVTFNPTIEWVPTVDQTDADKTVYVAEIAYNVDANYTFDIKVMDKSTNVNNGVAVDDNKAPYKFTVDKVNPEGSLSIPDYSTWEEIVAALTFGIYSKESFDINATALDKTSPIKVEYYKVSGDEAPAVLNVAAVTDWTEVDLSQSNKILTVGASEQFVVYLKITDKANHVHYVSTDGAIVEDIEPGITLEPSKPAADNGIQDVYGYYNDDVTVDISVVDDQTYSGIKTIEYWVTKDGVETARKTLYSFGYDGKYDTTKSWEITGSDVEAENKTYTGIPTQSMLKKSWAGSIVVSAEENNSCNVVVTVQVTDNAGIVSTKEVKLDIDYKEATAPAVEVKYDNHEGTQHNGWYYDDDRTATIIITERSHHFVEPTVYINKNVPTGATNYIHITAVDANGDNVAFNSTIEWVPTVDQTDADKTFYTAKIAYNIDANYTFDIKVMDKATNINNDVTADENNAPYKFTVDKLAPHGSITAIAYEAIDKLEETQGFTHTWEKFGEPLTYNYWSGLGIQITGQSVDDISPIESVQYYKSNSSVLMTREELADVTWQTFEGLDNEKNERFIVYLKVTDYAGNFAYISTDSLVVDNKNPSGAETEEVDIVITPQNVPATGIYTEDVMVSLTVYDPKYNDEVGNAANGYFSGLKEIHYEIYTLDVEEWKASGCLYGGELGEHLVMESVAVQSDETSGLVTSWSGNIVIPASVFNSNYVVVKVTAIDNAGNVRESNNEANLIKIDVSAPQIDIKYNINTPDSGSYYNADREATITITERNLNTENITITITKDGVAFTDYTITGWEPTTGAGNLDDSTHEATITFDQDGDYTFVIQCEDKAGWTCGNVADKTYNKEVVFAEGTQNPTEFTIDQTAPVVTVSYNNNSAQNDKYFNATRTATITITEHNFPIDESGPVDYTRVKFTMTAERGGTVPSTDSIAWTHEGDEHIAVIKFTLDGDYTFSVDVMDLAGKELKDENADYGKSVAGKDFVIDTTYADMISQEGVENGVAYGYDAEVIPNIKISDINLQEYKVTLVGVQKDKTINLTEEVNALLSKGTETVTGIFDLFETKQDLDGIYTLTMTSKDKAGNDDSMEIIFTVNRFGSVYVYEQYLVDLIANGGSYVYSVDEDLIITEYNADKLVTDSLKIEITVDGRPLEDVKFTVTPEINDTVSVGSSGWYQYKYTISKDNFKTDGVYKISVSSKDATGNTPENSNYEDMGMSFRVDSTQAEITSVVGLEEAIINAQNVTVKYTVFDTIGLKSVKVYVNGQLVDEITDFSADMNNFNGQFVINEQSSAQSVRIVVEDMSGNITDTSAEDFSSAYAFNSSVTVSTNIFVRWYANKGLFWGSIAGVVVLAGGVIFFIAAKRKKKEEEAASAK